MFFACPYCHLRLTFDEASEKEFWCSCGEDLVFQDNSEIIENIKENIKKTKKDLKKFQKKVK